MPLQEELFKQLPYCIDRVDLPALGTPYFGKVRDCYQVGSRRILVTTDRLSAFDVVLTTIPFKGELLNSIADFWFKQTADIAQNHIEARPHPNVFIARDLQIVPIEVVVRGYLCGSAWRDYQSGRAISGVTLPAGLKEFAQLTAPIITPSTKAEKGAHDQPISEAEIIGRKIVASNLWEEIRAVAFSLFKRGQEVAAKSGLILVDTKYEFGLDPETGALFLADEVHTQDSSRYWIRESYRQDGSAPVMLDKEFFRRYLLELGYSGDGTPPHIPDEKRVEVAATYIQTYEKITGERFLPKVGDKIGEIKAALLSLDL